MKLVAFENSDDIADDLPLSDEAERIKKPHGRCRDCVEHRVFGSAECNVCAVVANGRVVNDPEPGA
jgi:hypothetical protein